MLILTRKPGESLYIGDDIKITIVELKGHQIRVGIDAPKDKRIYREEIYLQILEENKSAAATAATGDVGLDSLTAAWTEMHGEGKHGGKLAETGGPANAGDSDKPKVPGLAAFSTLKVSTSTGSNASKHNLPSSVHVGTTTKDPQVVIRKKRNKNNDQE